MNKLFTISFLPPKWYTNYHTISSFLLFQALVLTSKHHSHSKCQCCISYLPVEAKLGLIRFMLNNNQFYFWNEPALNSLNLFFYWESTFTRWHFLEKYKKQTPNQASQRSRKDQAMKKWQNGIFFQMAII